MGHKMYNMIEQASNGQNPQKEVLLLYIKMLEDCYNVGLSMYNIPKWERQEYSAKCWNSSVKHHIKERGQYGDLLFIIKIAKYA